MGFFNRLFGGKSEPAPAQPEPIETAPSFPYELVSVPGENAVKQALRWREDWRGSFTPVILGSVKDFGLLTDVLADIKDSPQDFLERARNISLDEWFATRLEEAGSLDELTDASAWDPGKTPQDDFASVRDTLNKRFHRQVWIAKVPCALPCDVPAWLKLGGWNACPSAEEHAAVWRRWQEKYGAEILCVTGDVIEATVSRPPKEKDACYALAREQFAYCEDIVTQGVGSIDALASGLYGASSWFFWWD